MIDLDFYYIKVSQASVLLPIVFGGIWYKKADRSFKLLFWFYVLSAFFEIQASIVKAQLGNNLPGLHLFTIIEMFALSFVFYSHFKEKLVRRFIIVNAFVFMAVAAADAFVINSIWQHNTVSRPYSSMSLVIYSLIYFYKLLKSDTDTFGWQHPIFWLSLSVLIYFALNTFNFFLNNYFILHTQIAMTISVYTHALFNIIANSISAQSFRCFKTQKTK